jgi:heme/copper-type cytochrome/quinol oxidase subunit 2
MNVSALLMLRLDYAEHSSGFQDPASDWLLAIIDLHDRIVFYLILILAIVLWGLFSAILRDSADRPLGHMSALAHGNLLEMFWTASPALILWAIGLPSLKLLYLMDEVLDPEMTAKVTGSQWFWSYELGGLAGPIERFDSFMKGTADLEAGELRGLAVDSFLVLPASTAIRLLVTSADVIHSFALPALALKVDAIPGRLNLAGLLIARPGVFYGQCSELCGVLHGFMPIGLKALSLPEFYSYLSELATIKALISFNLHNEPILSRGADGGRGDRTERVR